MIEALMTAAQTRARKKGISLIRACEEILVENPQAYDAYLRERA
jgi:hypothetical protein